jgi:hypothetical protein
VRSAANAFPASSALPPPECRPAAHQIDARLARDGERHAAYSRRFQRSGKRRGAIRVGASHHQRSPSHGSSGRSDFAYRTLTEHDASSGGEFERHGR